MLPNIAFCNLSMNEQSYSNNSLKVCSSQISVCKSLSTIKVLKVSNTEIKLSQFPRKGSSSLLFFQKLPVISQRKFFQFCRKLQPKPSTLPSPQIFRSILSKQTKLVTFVYFSSLKELLNYVITSWSFNVGKLYSKKGFQ